MVGINSFFKVLQLFDIFNTLVRYRLSVLNCSLIAVRLYYCHTRNSMAYMQFFVLKTNEKCVSQY